MGYNGKLSTQGINILKNIYLSNPLIEFTEIQRKYNQEAKKYGLNQIKSSSTVANYLVRIGVYEKSSRRSKEEFEGIRRIKASGELQKEISSKLKVTTRSVFFSSVIRYQQPYSKTYPFVCPGSRSGTLRAEKIGKPV